MTTATPHLEGGETLAEAGDVDMLDAAWADPFDRFAHLDPSHLYWLGSEDPDAVADAWATLAEAGEPFVLVDLERHDPRAVEAVDELLRIHDDQAPAGTTLPRPRPTRRRRAGKTRKAVQA